MPRGEPLNTPGSRAFFPRRARLAYHRDSSIDHPMPLRMPARTFDRVYWAAAAATLAVVLCLPWLEPLSYRALGVDPAFARSGTHAAFQARMASVSLRSSFLSGVLMLAFALAALSIAALILRVRRRTNLPWPVALLTTALAAGVAVVALAGLVMQGGGMCC